MKRVFTSKQKRKQAEDNIIRHMNAILKRLEIHRSDKTDKEKVMDVLTRFLKIKNKTKH